MWQAGPPRWVPSPHLGYPFPQALGSVLRYLTDAKRKHSRILWVSLREEVVLEGNEQIYTLREPGSLDQLIPVPVSTPEQLEVSLSFGVHLVCLVLPWGNAFWVRCWSKASPLCIRASLLGITRSTGVSPQMVPREGCTKVSHWGCMKSAPQCCSWMVLQASSFPLSHLSSLYSKTVPYGPFQLNLTLLYIPVSFLQITGCRTEA